MVEKLFSAAFAMLAGLVLLVLSAVFAVLVWLGFIVHPALGIFIGAVLAVSAIIGWRSE